MIDTNTFCKTIFQENIIIFDMYHLSLSDDLIVIIYLFIHSYVYTHAAVPLHTCSANSD